MLQSLKIAQILSLSGIVFILSLGQKGTKHLIQIHLQSLDTESRNILFLTFETYHFPSQSDTKNHTLIHNLPGSGQFYLTKR